MIRDVVVLPADIEEPINRQGDVPVDLRRAASAALVARKGRPGHIPHVLDVHALIARQREVFERSATTFFHCAGH